MMHHRLTSPQPAVVGKMLISGLPARSTFYERARGCHWKIPRSPCTLPPPKRPKPPDPSTNNLPWPTLSFSRLQTDHCLPSVPTDVVAGSRRTRLPLRPLPGRGGCPPLPHSPHTEGRVMR